jgi:hypothetical protein
MTILLFILLLTMIVSVDGLTVAHLIMFKYKYITLRHYFETLKEDFVERNKSDPLRASQMLGDGLVEGIIMHKDLLK